MNRILAILLATAAFSSTCLAEDHSCAADARNRSAALLKLHFMMEAGDNGTDLAAIGARELQNSSIGEAVEILPPVKALKGKGRFDVLETVGYIYKGTYRMRMIYAQIPGSCLLMGQEILEEADPY